MKTTQKTTKTQATTKTAPKAKNATGAKGKATVAKTYRVFVLPSELWSSCKQVSHKADRSAGEFIDAAVAEHLPALTKELSALGLVQRGSTHRTRMARPTQWSQLLEASEKCGVPAIKLLILSMQRGLNDAKLLTKYPNDPSMRGSKNAK